MTRMIVRSGWPTLGETYPMWSASDLLDSFLSDSTFRRDGGTGFALNVYETAESYDLYAALPGVDISQLHITLDKNVLTVAGAYQPTALGYTTKGDEAKVVPQGKMLLGELRLGTFRRSLRVPEGLNAEGIRATYDNGVLHITMPRVAQAQVRHIPVNTGSNG